MKNLNKAIIIALGISMPLSAIASPGEDVTIRMMEANEHAVEAVTSHIELPEAADDHAKEHAAKGLETANNKRGGDHGDVDRDRDDVGRDRDHDMDGEERDRDHGMDREEERERDMDYDEGREREMGREEDREREMDRDDRKDIEHDGIDRVEIERDGFEDRDHGSNDSQPEFEVPDFSAPESDFETPHGPETSHDDSK